MTNKVFFHPGQPQLQAEVILASQGPHQKPLLTIRGRYPRMIHAEPSTHRMISQGALVTEDYSAGIGIMDDHSMSRNARSSRAVPVKTMLNEVRNMPFIPWHWGANQKGMQAGEECNELVSIPTETGGIHDVSREEAWLAARDAAVTSAEALMEAGYHKQIPNRLLEPFTWIDTLFTSTEWENFLWLRDHKDAEPHLQDFARLVDQAINDPLLKVQELEVGQWHLPYISDQDYEWAAERFNGEEENGWEHLRQVSAARCAWISYKPFGAPDGDWGEYEREMKTYNMLVSSDRVHASPLEHQAKPDKTKVITASSARKTEHSGEKTVIGSTEVLWRQPHLHGNLKGYIQYRKLVPGESHSG